MEEEIYLETVMAGFFHQSGLKCAYVSKHAPRIMLKLLLITPKNRHRGAACRGKKKNIPPQFDNSLDKHSGSKNGRRRKKLLFSALMSTFSDRYDNPPSIAEFSEQCIQD